MKKFRNYNPEQLQLLPPNVQDWLPEGHLATFISDIVDSFDLSEFYAAYDESKGGQPPYHPLMMVKLFCFAYCVGIHSSRQIEKATWESVPFRVLAAGEHPDHAVIADFRKKHLQAFANLFTQVLKFAIDSHLVDLNHVAIDGTKVKANADRNKSFSLEMVKKREDRLKAHTAEILAAAEKIDREEDEKYGDRSIYQLPKEYRSKEGRLKLIQEMKEKMEKEEQERKEAEEKERAKKEERQKPGGPKIGSPKKEDRPEKKLVRNLTDYESRIMRLPGGNWGQSYNAQIAVDGKNQIIVASSVTNEGNDIQQLAPMLKLTKKITGVLPKNVSADTGYFSRKALADKEFRGCNLLVPPMKAKPKELRKWNFGRRAFSPADLMREKLEKPTNKEIYKKRKTVVEPVFGQIKSAQQKFREFSFRGLAKVKKEWDLVCLAHNMLKLYGSKWSPA